LSECGIGLTEDGVNGELDEICVRDDERSRSCLRTLERRSNPWLIGEPCVGNPAIAEGIEQILSLPKMLESA
jgi:ATP-dependent Clp protease ATP-binding subunit ClpA